MGGISTNKHSKAHAIKDYVSWFEIPAVNFKQAVEFYNKIYGITMETVENESVSVAFFPVKSGIGGAIVSNLASAPGDKGPLLYLNGGDDLNRVLEMVEPAGGRVIMQKTLINEDSGYFAVFIDSEGNKLTLHSKK